MSISRDLMGVGELSDLCDLGLSPGLIGVVFSLFCTHHTTAYLEVANRNDQCDLGMQQPVWLATGKNI